MQAMTVAEALDNADEWIKGVTVYEGLQGWRVACHTLATEVRRLRAIEMAAANLIGQKGRHNTEIAYKRLEDAIANEGKEAIL